MRLEIKSLVRKAIWAVVVTGLAVRFFLAPFAEIHRVSPMSTGADGDRPLFVLLVGEDKKGLADAVHLAGLNLKEHRGTILNFPRNLVPAGAARIPSNVRSMGETAYRGYGLLSWCLMFGGPRQLAMTVERVTNIPIDYVVVIKFEGLKTLVTWLGGVTAYVSVDMNAPYLGAVFKKGVNTMNGSQALAFARNRHISGYDFRRTYHQGELIVALMEKMSQKLQNTIDSWYTRFSIVVPLMLFSDMKGASTSDVLALVKAIVETPSAQIGNISVPVRGWYSAYPFTVLGKDFLNVSIQRPAASALYADMADDGIVNEE